ncbi:MAG: DUF4153 domain-containing protein [Chloroflexota bacterium]
MNATNPLGMSDEIKANLSNPESLEKLYRSDRKAFRAAFESNYPEFENTGSAPFWKARLEYDSTPDILKAITIDEMITVAVACLVTAFLIKIPAMIHLPYSEEAFYFKNAAIIVFFGLSLYSLRNHRAVDPKKALMTGIGFLVIAVYSNLLPSEKPADAVELAYIHLPFLMWFIYGIVYTDYDFKNPGKRIDFIRHNGDLAIVYALIAIAGGILTGITIGLFESIGLSIEEFYMKNIVMTGAAVAPILAALIISKFPSLVSKTAPLIAAIFSPLVLITLVIFLFTMLMSGKDPYNDRDFLIIFNVMLLAVMGIIIFSVSETSVIKNQKFNAIILFALSIITIVIDLIALSAIFYRLGDGLTPNRLAVLVSNLLVLANLIMIMADLFRINFKKREFTLVEVTVARFLPVYLAWIIIVVFGFPLVFGMK